MPIIIDQQYIVMGRNKSHRGRTQQLPLFITKLLGMVEDQAIRSVISWTSAGDSFAIKSVTKFTEEVLPRYFRHKNFSSFIRQLNMYGFRKIRHQEGENVYKNEHFRVGDRSQLRHINRRMREEKEDRVAIYKGTGQKKEESRALVELKSSQKNLEQMFKQVLLQNQRLIQQNQNLVKQMENRAQDKERRIEDFLLMLVMQQRSREIQGGETMRICYGENGKYQCGVGKSELTPLEAIRNRLESDEIYQKSRGVIDRFYTKLQQSKNQSPQTTSNPSFSALLEDHSQLNEVELQQDDDGFLSIHNFMDADQFENQIHLEESR